VRDSTPIFYYSIFPCHEMKKNAFCVVSAGSHVVRVFGEQPTNVSKLQRKKKQKRKSKNSNWQGENKGGSLVAVRVSSHHKITPCLLELTLKLAPDKIRPRECMERVVRDVIICMYRRRNACASTSRRWMYASKGKI